VIPGSALPHRCRAWRAEALLDGDQVPRGQRPDPSVCRPSCDRQASRSVARQLADLCRGSAGGSPGCGDVLEWCSFGGSPL